MKVAGARRTPERAKLWVPPRFQDRIILFAVRVAAGQGGPTILLAVGEPGEGKTYSIARTAEKIGMAVFSIDAGHFESSEAGEPVRLLKETYLRAVRVASGQDPRRCESGQPCPAALMIDDVDLCLGRLGETQYTVNRQHLLAFLMALCDDPRRAFGRRVPRIPVFMTANDRSVLHGPLIRHGRAEVLPWKLTLDERRGVVGRIFSHLGENELERLIDWFPTEPVAFFADLNRLWTDKSARTEIARTTAQEALRLAVQGRWRIATDPPNLTALLTLGQKAQATRREGIFGEENDDRN